MEKRKYVRKKPPVKKGSRIPFEDRKAQGFYYVKRKYFKEFYLKVQELLKQYETPEETQARLNHPRNKKILDKLLNKDYNL